MKIYSWNVLFKNKNIEEVLSFIAALDFDVLALQEVSEGLLRKLEELPCEIATSTDTIRVDEEGNKSTDYLVILSKHSIKTKEVITFPGEWYQEPKVWQAGVSKRLLKWRHPYKSKSGLRVEIALADTESVQVFCAHLAVVFATPALRQKEFDFLLQRANKKLPIIFCGDFNILELPHVTLLNWLSGGTLKDWMWWREERTIFNRKFADYSFQNPLHGSITHPIALSQIDHILVPAKSQVVAKKVLQRKYGSDHNPVMVETR